MVANKHISKIIAVVMVIAVLSCVLAIGFSGNLTELLGGTTVGMEYETELFNTDEIITVDIQMDEDEWKKMLTNAMSEEYYVCNVVVNGKKIRNVAIRPKGNTSLSAIASDPDSDRYSLKLEFDHFVDGQTCYGLDKLILNNNYADATNMKEAVIYDMYRFIGANASLYNYAEVSVNGEYWGVYLALEGVEDSFMLRNFGTQDGELYKPDSMEMGGGNSSKGNSSDSKGGFSMPNMDFSNADPSSFGASDFGGKTPTLKDSGSSTDRKSFGDGSFSGRSRGSSSKGKDAQDQTDFNPGNMPDMSSFDPNNMPGGGNFSFDPNNMPDGGNFSFDPNSMPDDGNFSFDPSDFMGQGGSETGNGSQASDAKDKNDSSGSRRGGGGFSMGGGGANLNYNGDDLDNYSTIWDGALTGTNTADHRRIVTALKNISEGTDLEKYLDVDNILKYMAVHTFSVNMDSLSGSMAHNYYLYEYQGQLNIFPWDYNLSLGGMSMGSSGNGTDLVNDPIDTPFSGTKFFNTLLENEEYLAKYHEYLQKLYDEYVTNQRFDKLYVKIRSRIDSLVDKDPTAFYTYEEYQTAAQMFYDTVLLRFESIKGQLDGTIPSTDAGQRQDSSALVDGSNIDVKVMGQFSMGGGGGFGFGGNKDRSGSDKEDQTDNRSEDQEKGSMPDMSSFNPGSMPGMGGDESDFAGSKGTDSSKEAAMESSSDTDGGESSSDIDLTRAGRRRREFSGMPGQQTNSALTKNLILYGSCLAAALIALIIVKCLKRRGKRLLRPER